MGFPCLLVFSSLIIKLICGGDCGGVMLRLISLLFVLDPVSAIVFRQ